MTTDIAEVLIGSLFAGALVGIVARLLAHVRDIFTN